MKPTIHPTRGTYLSKHHLHPKVRGGNRHPSNILRLWRDKHDSFHFVFGNLNLDEIIAQLVKQSKPLQVTSTSKHWLFLFGLKEFTEVIALLKRVKRIKSRLKR